MILLQLLRRQVKTVLADECDYSLAGQSSRYAIAVFSIAMVIAMFALMYFGQTNQKLMDLASIFGYLVCTLMLLNSAIFYFLRSRLKSEQKGLWKSTKAALPQIILAVIIAIIFTVGTLRLFSGEDGWVCQDGQWIEHGHPDYPMPHKTCK
jgi:cytochrome b561